MILSYRSKAVRLVAGIMSGTSLDGIDVAFVEVSGTGSSLQQHLCGFHTVACSPTMKLQLMAASNGEMMLREAFELHVDLGTHYTNAIGEAADATGIDPKMLDAVGLHGQTVYHNPKRLPNGVTVQLGSAAAVAQSLGTVVVSDFRSNDVAAGGEGAPLVPYCDYVLLHSPILNRVALNIGGIANITWLPAVCSPDSLIAFDTGPGNMLIDAAMRFLYDREFDEDGTVAASGTASETWLLELLDDPYYWRVPPKSSGRERFGQQTGTSYVQRGVEHGLEPQDIVATLTLLTARTITNSIRSYAAKGDAIDEVIVGGGGANNHKLMMMVSEELPGTHIVPGDELGLPADAKEAICFAILANEALCETPTGLPGVTGASRSVICGTITLP